ncbi:MAG: TonB-dependent receptor [Pseudomonadota bacterium]
MRFYTHLKASVSAAGLLVLGGGLLAAGPAQAQLDEITITAERRADTLQNVAIAVTAFSADDLDLKQINEPLDLIDYVPNLIGSNNTGLGSANVYYIRGLGNTESIATFDPPVGTYVDEVYIARQNGNNISFFDVERIEVLRGPQGTLFGRNTTGGAVSVVMKKPGEELGGFAELGYGSYDRFTSRASVDLPLSDKVLTKLSGFYVEDEGYVDNIATGEKLNGQEAFGVRGDLRFLLAENVTWDVAADYVDDETTNILNYVEGGSPLLASNDSGDRVANTGLRTSGGSGSLLDQALAGQGLGSSQESFSLTSNLEFDTDFGVFNIITGYRSLDQKYVLDFFDGGLGGEQFLAGGFTIANDAEHEQFSQEIKFSNTFMDGFVDVIAGAYFFVEDNTTDFADIFVAADLDPGPGFNPTPGVTANRIIENTLDSLAVYAQADFHPTDKLTLTAGLRWTEEDKEIEFFDKTGGGLNTAAIAAAGIPTEQTQALVTPRFVADYKVTDDVSFFASATNGFKSGGWNARSSNPALLQAFDAEVVWSYEAGLRSQWFEDRFRANITAFFMDVEDFQIPSAFNDGSGSLQFITGNFAGLENKGVEIELEAAPIDNLNLYASVGIQDSEYVDLAPATAQQFADAQTDPSLCGRGIVAPSCQISEPVRAPDVTATFGGSYEFKPTDMPYYVRPSLNVRYVGENFTGTSNLANSLEDGYWLLNAGAAFGEENSRWTIIVDCRNCTDEVFITSNLPPTVYLNEPRRWSVRLRLQQ